MPNICLFESLYLQDDYVLLPWFHLLMMILKLQASIHSIINSSRWCKVKASIHSIINSSRWCKVTSIKLAQVDAHTQQATYLLLVSRNPIKILFIVACIYSCCINSTVVIKFLVDMRVVQCISYRIHCGCEAFFFPALVSILLTWIKFRYKYFPTVLF